MATPQIGQRATLKGKPVIWSGNHGWQSPASYAKLEKQGKFKLGSQALDRLANTPIIQGLKQHFSKPTPKPLQKVMDASQHLPGARAMEGAGVLANNLAGALNVDPRIGASALLLGSLKTGSGKIPQPPRVPSIRGRQPSFSPRQTGSLNSLSGKPSTGSSVTQPAPPKFDRSRLAQAADKALTAKAVRDSGTASQRQQLAQSLRGVDVASEARGPALKQFGGRNSKEAAVITDNLSIGQQSGASGRPSASQSSPHLRQVREGVRKATGLQRQREELNARRSGGSPGSNKVQPVRPVSPARQDRLSSALERQQAAKANQPDPRTIRNARAADYGIDKGDKPLQARERPLAQGENPRPKGPKAEKSQPSKPQPQQRPNRPLSYSSPKPVRTTAQQKADALAAAKQGEVRGTIGSILKTIGKEMNPGRSPAAVRQTARTLKAALERATSPAQRQRIQGLLDRLK